MNDGADSDTLLSRIEDASLNASAPPQQRWLDGWLLRHCPAKAKRARCINPLAPGQLALAERLALAEQFYAAIGLPLLIRITPFVPAGLDAALANLGLILQDETLVMAQPTLTERFGAEPAPDDTLPPGTTLQPVDADTYAEVVGSLRGTQPEQRRAHAERLRASPVPYQGFVLGGPGTGPTSSSVLACGQLAREDERVGLYDVFVAPEARGHGLARQLCAALLRRAVSEGARTGYLQVEPDNPAAQRVYARLGFREVYRYHYRVRPDAI
jgi:ribosomal protein S18 acetylase RimI-like enzyme